jgi:hypothetical protein
VGKYLCTLRRKYFIHSNFSFLLQMNQKKSLPDIQYGFCPFPLAKEERRFFHLEINTRSV